MRISLIIFVIIVSFAGQIVAFAQPGPPITWGDIRLLQNPDEIDGMETIYSKGDTIVLIAAHAAGGGDILPMVTITGNNGSTWSPWYIFSSDDPSGSYITIAFTSSSILAAVNVSNSFYGVYRSEDLGESWQQPDTIILDLRLHDAKNDTVYCNAQPNAVLWSANDGVSFSPARPLDFGFYPTRDLEVSDTFLQAMSIMRYQGRQLNARYTRGPLLEGEFEPHRAINDVYCTYGADMEFARDGVGVLASVVLFEPPVPDYGRLFINTTRDDGTTWSEADTMNEFDTAGALNVIVRNHGHLWAVVTTDTVVSPGFDYDGMYVSFSANHARSWYPRQQATGDDVFGGALADVDLQPDRIRVYAYYARWNDVLGKYSFQWEGLIRRDTLAPFLSNAEQQPALVPLDTTLTFRAAASDEDSLWLMQVVLREENGDSALLDLLRTAENGYAATWQVPNDSTIWTYYYLAEDMWENVARVPDDGAWSFVAGGITSSPDHPVVESFDLRVYPNPTNGSVVITGWPLHTQPTLIIHNILGRELIRLNPGTEARITWNLADKQGSEVPTGMYFIRAEPTKQFSKSVSLTIIK